MSSKKYEEQLFCLGARLRELWSVEFWTLAEYRRSKVCLTGMVFAVNMAFAIVGPSLRATDFASHLLFVLQANLVMYATFYIFMKMRHPDEMLRRATIACFVMALLTWVPGMYFFTRK